MENNYDYEVIEAYEFMLPIVIERYKRIDILCYQIPIEQNEIFGDTSQRMMALRIAIDLVRKLNKLYKELKVYKTELAEASNWGSSSVLLSKEFLNSISDGINERKKIPLQRVIEINNKIESLKCEAIHKIRVIYLIDEKKGQ